MLLFSASLTYAFGLLLGRKKQGWALFAAFMVLLVASVAIVYPAEQYGNPLLTRSGRTRA